VLVSVTGGSGFVGSHSVAALQRAGIDVRVLVRDPARAGPALDALGVDSARIEFVTGDVTDPAAARRVVRGADAVLHAASVYSFDVRDRAAVRATNLAGTELILEAAVKAGLGPIVHVSTVGALFPAPDGPIGPGSAPGRPREAYLASKAASEAIARRHQQAGAPVLISYPPALLGPGDPRLGDQTARLRDTVRGLMPIWPGGGFPLGDVRDTADFHARLFTEPGGAPRRFAPNSFVSTREYLRAVRAATGRALPCAHLPARWLLPVGRAADLAQRFWPWHIPAEYGAVYTCVHAVLVAPEAAEPPTRPLARTVADTLRWLLENGLITPRQAGPGLRAAAEAGRGETSAADRSHV
jgi:nucleoside-diphosphate-sugar epimerase